MTLVGGSYERFLFGYSYDSTTSSQLDRSFTYAAHKAAVKCLASAGPFLASGGVDDLIHIYDMRLGKDLGYLMNPGQGAVTALSFFTPNNDNSNNNPQQPLYYAPTHLLAGSEDGQLSVWQAGGTWELLKVIKGHKKAINSISIHPSGQLAITVSRDNSLRMWNLVKGRCTYTAPLEEEAQHVAFDNEGGMYALLTGNKLTVFSTVLDNNNNDDDDDGVVAVFSYERRLLCMTWVNNGDNEKMLLTGGEDGSMHILRLTNDEKKKTLQHGIIKQAHATRIKGIVVVNPSSTSASSSMLCGSAASDGVIKLWNLTTIIAQFRSSEKEGSAVIDGDECVVSEARTTARLTSLCALDSKSDMEAGAKVDTHRKKQYTQQQNVANSNNTHGGDSKKDNKGGGRKRKGVEVVEKKKEKKEEEEGKGEGELVDFVTKEELETMKKKQQHRVQTVQAKKKNRAKKQNRERQGREGE
jgi:WD40 repeat protein